MKSLVFNTLLQFTLFWDHKATNAFVANKPGVYSSDEVQNLSKLIKNHLKCDATDGSVVNDLNQPILNSFVLDEARAYKAICQFETIHYRKINKSVLNTMTISLENYNHKEVNFNRETLTFT